MGYYLKDNFKIPRRKLRVGEFVMAKRGGNIGYGQIVAVEGDSLRVTRWIGDRFKGGIAVLSKYRVEHMLNRDEYVWVDGRTLNDIASSRVLYGPPTVVEEMRTAELNERGNSDTEEG